MRIFTQPICPRDDSTKNPLWEYSHKLYLRSYRFCIGFLPLVTLTHLLLLLLYIYNINLTTGRGGADCIFVEYRGAGFVFHHNIRALFGWGSVPLCGYIIFFDTMR